MKYISQKDKVLENLQQARKILKNNRRDEEDELFKKLRNLTEEKFNNNIGYLGFFTKLIFDKKYKLKDIERLSDIIINNKQVLKDLPNQIVTYDNIEKIEDDINIANEWLLYNRQFSSRLKGNLKQEARKDEEFKNVWNNLEPDVKEDVVKNFLPKIGRYNSYTIFKRDLMSFLNKEHSEEKIIESINNTDNVYLVHNLDGIIVAEVLDYNGSCAIGSKSWCISTSSTYWETYNSVKHDTKQYFVWNLNVPLSNIESMVGVTIKKDGTVRTAHLKNDKYVDFKSYANTYNIDMSIFKPLSIINDFEKIAKARGLSSALIQKLYDEKGGEEKLKSIAHKLPFNQRIKFDLLSDEEKSNMSVEESIPYFLTEKNKHIVNGIIDVCNELPNGTEEDVIKIKKDNKYYKYIETFDLEDKAHFVNIHGGFNTYGLDYFFEKEIQDYRELNDSNLTISLDRYDDVIFEFEMEIDYYLENILNTTEDVYYGMNYLDDPDQLLNWAEAEEDNYIHNFFQDDVAKKFRELLSKMKEYYYHPKVIELLDNCIKDFYTFDDKFADTISYFKHLEPKLDTDNYKGIFYEYMEKISYSAQDLVNQDQQNWENNLIGTFNHSRGYRSNTKSSWEIEFDDVIKILNDKSYSNIADFITGGVNNFDEFPSFHFQNEYPYIGDYIYEADREEADNYLLEAMDEILTEGFENAEEFTDNIKAEKLLTKHGWNAVAVDYNYTQNWYGYRYDTEMEGDTLEVKVRDEDGNYVMIPNTRDYKMKVQTFNRYYLIPLNSITEYEYLIFQLNRPIGEYNNINYRMLSYELTNYNKDYLDKANIKVIKKEYDKIEDYEFNPNQLELKFEKKIIKSFQRFKQRL